MTPARNRFNTWAREEPNNDVCFFCQKFRVSILGLARSPTFGLCFEKMTDFVSILGLARSPTPLTFKKSEGWLVSILGLARSPTSRSMGYCFRKEVSILGLARSPTRCRRITHRWSRFQYLGSRGAQPGWLINPDIPRQVSILGLARSPTSKVFCKHGTAEGFNTWAREEPN